MNLLLLPHGVNFSSSELAASTLARALCRTASFLQDIEPHGVQLHQYEDWWQHDGLHFHKGTINLHALFEMVKSPRSLVLATPDDEAVFVGVAPVDMRWYLRFRLWWNDEGYELLGRFDITLPSELANHYRQNVIEWLGLQLQEQEASTYYRFISAGGN